MAVIRQAIEDVMQRVRTELPQFQTIRIWNNQIQAEAEGQYQAYAKPAIFVEVLNDMVWEQLGGGFSGSDLAFRFHIVHEYYDAQDGSFEQDLVVFDLRDALIAKFMLYKPVGCGPMTKITEVQDYDHANVYHYLVDFATHFIDAAGVPVTIEVASAELEQNTQFIEPKNYIIPQ
jgi:hypothetical protein